MFLRIVLVLFLAFPCFGGATFDATDDYLINTSYPITSGDFTVYVVAKVDITGSTHSALASTNNTGTTLNRGWVFRAEQYNNTGYVGATFYGVADYTTTIATPTGWAVYILRHDDSTNNIYFDINGTSQSRTALTPLIASLPDGILIGASRRNSSAGLGNWLNAEVSEFAIWNSFLTNAEVDLLTNAQTKMVALQIQTSNLKEYCMMDDFSDGATMSGSDTVLDMSSNGFHLTPNGSIVSYAEEFMSYPSGPIFVNYTTGAAPANTEYFHFNRFNTSINQGFN